MPKRFYCPNCNYEQSHEINCHRFYKRTRYKKGDARATLYSYYINLIKWLWAIYFLRLNKGSTSAFRLSKLIELNDTLIANRQKIKRG